MTALALRAVILRLGAVVLLDDLAQLGRHEHHGLQQLLGLLFVFARLHTLFALLYVLAIRAKYVRLRVRIPPGVYDGCCFWVYPELV